MPLALHAECPPNSHQHSCGRQPVPESQRDSAISPGLTRRATLDPLRESAQPQRGCVSPRRSRDEERTSFRSRDGGGLRRVEIGDIEIAAEVPDDELLAVHEALDAFAAHDPQKAELVKLRYFARLTIGEAAAVVGISPATAKRYWAYARAWLFRDIRSQNTLDLGR